MEAGMWFVWAVIALLTGIAVAILLGKGDFLVFGKKRKNIEAYHIHRVRLVYGIGVLLIAAWLTAFGLFGRQFPQGTRSWVTAVAPVALLGMTLLKEMVCRKQGS